MDEHVLPTLTLDEAITSSSFQEPLRPFRRPSGSTWSNAPSSVTIERRGRSPNPLRNSPTHPPAGVARRSTGVAQEGGWRSRHRPDAAGHRRQMPCDLRNGGVSIQAEPLRKPCDADVDDCSAGLDHVERHDEVRPTSAGRRRRPPRAYARRDPRIASGRWSRSRSPPASRCAIGLPTRVRSGRSRRRDAPRARRRARRPDRCTPPGWPGRMNFAFDRAGRR